MDCLLHSLQAVDTVPQAITAFDQRQQGRRQVVAPAGQAILSQRLAGLLQFLPQSAAQA
ncbi:hypothetical protein SAMN05421779_104270 [Insolitispirillum peregrinum]|uniref:Uncharacterized protein n=1 Tax=Insolitispirillum peregrinum TaxID=80876 RepID=A0A1N7MPV9_9PROT|nr:hypothetical protein SAMN05421779_104270 [Insolitispirillum peregrinum]